MSERGRASFNLTLCGEETAQGRVAPIARGYGLGVEDRADERWADGWRADERGKGS